MEGYFVMPASKLKQGALFKHLHTGTVVAIREITKTGAVIWESIDAKQRIEKHSWGKMKSVNFLKEFKSMAGSQSVKTSRGDSGTDHRVHPN
jgi:hypothetical protein